MEQTLTIDGKKYNLLYKGKTASIYRDYFNRDLLVDIQEVQIKFGEAIEKNVREGNPDRDPYFTLLQANGSLFFERLVWACIKTYDTYHGKETKAFQDFVDDIEDYQTYVMSGVVILEQIINANKATVKDESDEVVSDDKKKEA